MKKKQHSTWHCGNANGFIFTLDAIIAAFVLIIVIVFVHFFAARAAEDKLAIIQPTVLVSDALTYLAANHTLQTKDKDVIGQNLDALLPHHFQTRVQLRFSTNESTIDIGEEIPRGIFISSGKRYIAIENGYGAVRYWIWLKE